MDPATPMGAAMRNPGVVLLLTIILHASPVRCADRYAVVITGASAGPPYAEKYDAWRTSLVAKLEQFGYPDEHVFVLAETAGTHVAQATRENVRGVFTRLRSTLSTDDLLLVILIGHGTIGDRDDGKFNLVGPDLTSGEWADLVKPVPGRLIFVDTTGGSFPFMRRLSAPGRIVVTASDSTAQQFETVFPEFFVKAFADSAADLDKNGRVSIWEAFSYASDAVRRWYDQHGQLPTERPLLDDNGDGIGREAQNPGPDGGVASAVYLVPDRSAPADEQIAARRLELQHRLDDLRIRKAAAADPAQYDAEIEQVLLEIARLPRAAVSNPRP
jgi:hypothetical protein